MSILSELYAQGGEEVILNTVEFRSPAWSEPIVLVQDYVNHEITTEDGRRLSALASGMSVSLPKRNAQGAQKINFAIDGLSVEDLTRVRMAISHDKPIDFIFRVYVSSDLSYPAEKPYKFVVHSISITRGRVDLTAGLFDFIDMRYPREVFDSDTAPALKFS